MCYHQVQLTMQYTYKMTINGKLTLYFQDMLTNLAGQCVVEPDYLLPRLQAMSWECVDDLAPINALA